MRTETKISEEKRYLDRLSKFNLDEIIKGDNFFFLESYHDNFYAFNFVEKPEHGPMYLQIYIRSTKCQTLLQKLLNKGYSVTQEINAAINSEDMNCICIEGFVHVKAFIKSFLNERTSPALLVQLNKLYERYFKNRSVSNPQSPVSSNRYSLRYNDRRFENLPRPVLCRTPRPT